LIRASRSAGRRRIHDRLRRRFYVNWEGALMHDNVTATPAALKLLAEIVAEHGPVLFRQSGGCCDGSAPMCYPAGEFVIGDQDVLLGHIGGMPFYIGASQFEAWKHTDLIIDVVPRRGGGRKQRFLTRSTVCPVGPTSE
jgi:uncharacterized protein